MPRRLVQFLLVLCLLTPYPGYSFDISDHKQLVISVTNSWCDFHAKVYLFEQSRGKWLRVEKAMPAVVGRNGLAWDPSVADRAMAQPVKNEGDGKAPAGIFPLSLAMGFSSLTLEGIALPYRSIEQGTQCIDDRSSHYYNRIVPEKGVPSADWNKWRSSERMWEMADVYQNLLVVDYNVMEPKPGAGSCIFMHIWRSASKPTSGCTALAEKDLTAISKWLKPDAKPVLVQLPKDEYRRFWRQWQLPAPALVDAEKSNVSLVDLRSAAPDVVVDMRYARSDNFTGQAVYDCGRCFLRPETAEKVARAERELGKMGLRLKMWDCYRPLSVQKLFWSLVPDPRYVADPRTGSRHNYGNAVDVTVVDKTGRELEMPTKFDDFSPRAAHGEMHLPAHVLENRQLLAETMKKAGFRPLPTEWWHYDDPGSGGEIMDIPFQELCR